MYSEGNVPAKDILTGKKGVGEMVEVVVVVVVLVV